MATDSSNQLNFNPTTTIEENPRRRHHSNFRFFSATPFLLWKVFDDCTKRVWLHKRTGGVCLSIASKGLAITRIDDCRYWNHIPTEESRDRTKSILGRLPTNDNPPTIIMSDLLPVFVSLSPMAAIFLKKKRKERAFS
nr:f-box protein pp2-a12 [Quercus suber]